MFVPEFREDNGGRLFSFPPAPSEDRHLKRVQEALKRKGKGAPETT